jgi:hypothetical protein
MNLFRLTRLSFFRGPTTVDVCAHSRRQLRLCNDYNVPNAYGVLSILSISYYDNDNYYGMRISIKYTSRRLNRRQLTHAHASIVV